MLEILKVPMSLTTTLALDKQGYETLLRRQTVVENIADGDAMARVATKIANYVYRRLFGDESMKLHGRRHLQVMPSWAIAATWVPNVGLGRMARALEIRTRVKNCKDRIKTAKHTAWILHNARRPTWEELTEDSSGTSD